MVSNHVSNHHPEMFINIIQGKIFSNLNQLPKIIWNQMKILLLTNKHGKSIDRSIKKIYIDSLFFFVSIRIYSRTRYVNN